MVHKVELGHFSVSQHGHCPYVTCWGVCLDPKKNQTVILALKACIDKDGMIVLSTHVVQCPTYRVPPCAIIQATGGMGFKYTSGRTQFSHNAGDNISMIIIFTVYPLSIRAPIVSNSQA
jgi:hypothetical protein